MKKGKVMVAMSGGVDSSVAAYLLKEEGWEVTGANLVLWDNPGKVKEDAEKVCRDLGIPFQRFDLSELFQERIMDYFCREYLDCRTPNPCARCNPLIKFGRLRELAEGMGIPYLATGHYARIESDPRFPGPVLKIGRDPDKDQSYALFGLNREDLGRFLFPLGGLTKGETRKRAEEAGLHVSNASESQDICFIPDGDYARFILDRFPESFSPGPIRNLEGEVLGMHKGLYHYTIGQRRGIGVAAKRPYYVLALHGEENALIVGHEEDTAADRFEVSGVNWLVPPRAEPFEAQVKIRYSSTPCSAKVTPLEDQKAAVQCLKPQKAITPGQAAVFYDQEIILGGGWIL